MFSSPFRVDHHGGGYSGEYKPMTLEEWSQHAYETLRALQGIIVAERREASFLMKPVMGGIKKACDALIDEYLDYIIGERERDARLLQTIKKATKKETGK